MGRASILMVIAAGFVMGIMNLNIHRSNSGSVSDMVGYYSESVARVIANEGMCYLLTQLADSTTLRVTTPKIFPSNLFADLGPYSGTYTIANDSILVNGALKQVTRLHLVVKFLEATDTILVYADALPGFRPKSIRGAFTANDTINKTISDMTIDGRDHDLSGNLIAGGSGVFGVSTSVPFQNVQNGAIGGTTATGVNIAPSYPENPAIIEQNYNWLEGFPNTPDGALGYTEGKLKALAQSGINGSQYVTDPTKLKFPLKGVTYVEVPSGNTKFDRMDFGNSTGILIVHNSTGDARVTNMLQKNANQAPFKGIIIADYAFHIHMNIIGAILLLSKNLEKEKECMGNAGMKVLFSNEAVRQATGIAIAGTGSGWQGRVPIIGWRE